MNPFPKQMGAQDRMSFAMKWPPAGRVWLALCALAAALAVLGGIGIALEAATTRIDDRVAEPAELASGAERRCPHCGWIESKREIAPGTADPHALKSYEYTVRMNDGSSSVFQQVLPVSWRLRERLSVIGQEKARDGVAVTGPGTASIR